MNRSTIATILITIFSLVFSNSNAQGSSNSSTDFDRYIVNLVKADWVLHNTRMRYVNSHEEDQTVTLEEMKGKFSKFITDICKRHKDSMCLLVEDTTFFKIIKPYEADHTLYKKIYNKQVCVIPYSKVKHKAIQGYINKDMVADDYFKKFYSTYGIRVQE